jgi:hypothetical protein
MVPQILTVFLCLRYYEKCKFRVMHDVQTHPNIVIITIVVGCLKTILSLYQRSLGGL